MSKDKRDKLLLVCIAALGVCSILYFWVIVAKNDQTSDLHQKVLGLESKKRTSEGQVKRQAQVEADLEEARQKLSKLQADMFKPGEKDHVRYLQILARRGTDHRLTVQDVVPPVPMAEAGILPLFPFQAQRMQVVMLGSYVDFGRFLADLENDFPYMRIQQLGIQPQVALTTGRAGAVPDSVSASGVEAEMLRFDFQLIVLIASQL